MMAMKLRSSAIQLQRQQRSDAGRRQRGEDGDRMNVAFIQDPQHNIDRHQGRSDQQGLIRQRVLKRLRYALKAAADGGWQANLAGGPLDRRDRVAKRRTGYEIERDGDGGKQALMIDDERCVGGGIVREGAERHQRAVRRPHIDVLKAIGILPEARLYFQDHTVLIQLLVHGGDLTLAKGIIERIGRSPRC